MFSKVLISLFCLSTGVLSAHPAVDFLERENLDTPEGRSVFLQEKLSPYAMRAIELQQKSSALSAEANVLSPEHDQAQILEIAQKVVQETSELVAMLPILEQSLRIEEDFQQIDEILQNPDSLTPSQEEVLQRLERICQALN